jgi:hypothetical protein
VAAGKQAGEPRGGGGGSGRGGGGEVKTDAIIGDGLVGAMKVLSSVLV